MQAQAALVGTDGAVELDAIAAVDLDLTLVVQPGHAKHELALRLHDPFEDLVLLVLWVAVQTRLQRLEHLSHSLVELRLPGVSLLHQVDHSLRVGHVDLRE